MSFVLASEESASSSLSSRDVESQSRECHDFIVMPSIECDKATIGYHGTPHKCPDNQKINLVQDQV
uniref:Uncharacterized protein n=1 Tax=Rhizophora mucronata TaxID=61149 RepID=A0A2P2QL74_RHIMU